MKKKKAEKEYGDKHAYGNRAFSRTKGRNPLFFPLRALQRIV